MNDVYDIAIVGGGIVGSLAALLLAECDFRVLLIDASPESSSNYFDRDNKLDLQCAPDLRMSALTLKSEEILEQFRAFDFISNRKGLMKKVVAFDENLTSEIVLDSLLIGKSKLASIVENNLLLEVLINKINSETNINLLKNCKINNILKIDKKFVINTKDNEYVAGLVIGSDGGNSFIRKHFNYNLNIKGYNHKAIVCNVQTEKPHINTAYQCFLNDGPLAFLPWMQSNTCSIVWSQSPEQTDYWLAADESEFKLTLQKKINSRLGKVLDVSERVAFPLYERQVEQYYKEGTVLIGDAAHTIHPLAGQGLNLGIYDAYALAEVLTTAKTKQQDIASDFVLNNYELKRQGHNQQMSHLMRLLKEIHGSDSKILSMVRSLGVNVLNNIGFAKKLMAKYAAGYV